jgi:hypothetical protein
MQGCVDGRTGRVRLIPSIKTWMRGHLDREFSGREVWDGAMGFGYEAERINPAICPHCVANHLYDVLERAHRMKERANGT